MGIGDVDGGGSIVYLVVVVPGQREREREGKRGERWKERIFFLWDSYAFVLRYSWNNDVYKVYRKRCI